MNEMNNLSTATEAMASELPKVINKAMREALKRIGQTATTKYMIRSSGERNLTYPRLTANVSQAVDPLRLTWRSGRLARSLVQTDNSANITKISNEANIFKGTLGINLAPIPEGVPYARIHELGGDIRPKIKKILAWVTSGERPTTPEGWRLAKKAGRAVFSMHSHIPSRPYLMPAIRDKQLIEESKEILAGSVIQLIRSATLEALKLKAS